MPALYRYNILKKELRLDFRDQRNGKFKLPSLGIFAALLALAIHFILQTMTETVLSDVIPEFMSRSNFSLIFAYNLSFLTTLCINKMVHFRTRTFAETQKNYWYLQAKMGYKPSFLVLCKIAARIIVTTTSYVLGFLAVLLIGYLLKYNFIYSYIITLFLSGLGDSLIILVLILTSSMLVQDSRYNTLTVLLVGIGHQIAKHASGRYGLISQPSFMRNIAQAFNFADSPYLVYQLAVTVTCLIFVIIGARYTAFYYHYPREVINRTPANFTVGRIKKSKLSPKKDHVIGRVERGDYAYPIVLIPDPATEASQVAKLAETLLTVAATLMIVLMLVFNVFVLFMSASQKTREVSINGTIPYLFHSDTMDPAIERNDLVYFQKIDVQSVLNPGDIVIFRDNYEIFIERIIAIRDDKYIVDIDNYPPLAKEDAMLKTIEREAIYGRYSGRDRWLGAIIHFANTVTGRILFLLIPSVLLFYHEKLYKQLERLLHREPDPELIESQRALHEKRQLERLSTEQSEAGGN